MPTTLDYLRNPNLTPELRNKFLFTAVAQGYFDVVFCALVDVYNAHPTKTKMLLLYDSFCTGGGILSTQRLRDAATAVVVPSSFGQSAKVKVADLANTISSFLGKFKSPAGTSASSSTAASTSTGANRAASTSASTGAGSSAAASPSTNASAVADLSKEQPLHEIVKVYATLLAQAENQQPGIRELAGFLRNPPASLFDSMSEQINRAIGDWNSPVNQSIIKTATISNLGDQPIFRAVLSSREGARRQENINKWLQFIERCRMENEFVEFVQGIDGRLVPAPSPIR